MRKAGLKDYMTWAGQLASSDDMIIPNSKPQVLDVRVDNPKADESKTPSVLPSGHAGKKPAVVEPSAKGKAQTRKMTDDDEKLSSLFQQISSDLDLTLAENKRVLGLKYGTGQYSNQTTTYNQEHENVKRNILSLVASVTNNAKINEKLPRWKHKLRGNHEPKIADILSGKRLFRAIAWGVILLTIRNKIAVRRRKLLLKEKHASEVKLNLILFADSCSVWLGRLVSVPFISIENDAYLDFSSRSSSAKATKLRLLQFKVRFRAIIDNITQLGLPPDYIIDFLTVFCEDGTYFDDKYLWSCERDGLRFDEYGGTIDMLQPTEKLGSDNCTVAVDGIQGIEIIDACRVKMMIKNFLIVRILIFHVTLSPWFIGVVHKPVQRVSKVVHNFRIIASVLYILCTRIDSLLSPLPAKMQIFESSDIQDTSTQDHSSWLFHLFWRTLFVNKEERERTEAEAAANSQIETNLLSHQREWFGPLIEAQRLLVPTSDISWLQPEADEWISDLATKLDSWLATVVKAVLERRFDRIRQKIAQS